MQAAEAAQPAHGALDGPAVPTKPGGGLDAPAGDAGRDNASTELPDRRGHGEETLGLGRRQVRLRGIRD
jgi:hypothetical protein